VCYNDYSKREEDTKMLNWYENPEIHAEDYEEMLELLAALAEEEPEG
jgi:hypothetical protein